MDEENKAPEGESAKKNAASAEETEENKNSAQNTQETDESTKKIICALGYLFGILFFLPLVLYPQDDFARFHANQALAVLIVTVAGEVVFGILCAFLPILGILCGVFGLAMFIACIYAVVGAAKGEKWNIPLIEKIRILK